MIKKIEAALLHFVDTRLKGPKDAFMNFYILRQEREKRMIVGLGLSFLLFTDYWLCIHPVIDVFTRVMPELTDKRRQLDELVTDKKNEALVLQSWETTRQNLADAEARFVAPNELPTLLESLSKLAQSSGVKILSVEPREIARSRMLEPYARIPIRVSALAGTHELGRFLAALENSKTYFRVANVKIAVNPPEPRRHSVELSLWAYRKG